MKKIERPLTQRELRQSKKVKQDEEYILIHNICKQMIPIQLKPPIGVDFYQGEQTVPLNRGKSAKFPKSRLRMTQVENLQKSGMIRIGISK
jgi:hypothetical protein